MGCVGLGLLLGMPAWGMGAGPESACEQIDQVEERWTSDSPAAYFQAVLDVMTGLDGETLPEGDGDCLGRLLIRLTQRSPSEEIIKLDIEAMAAVYRVFERYYYARPYTQEEMQTRAIYIHWLRQEWNPDYERLEQILLPTEGITFPTWGPIDPARITDPVAREKYEAALKYNQDARDMNQRQSRLYKENQSVSISFRSFLSNMHQSGQLSLNEAMQLMEMAGFSEEEQAEIRTELSR
jgi:hypothetical protein